MSDESTVKEGLTTYDKILSSWNIQADEFNQWDNLSNEEQIEFTVRHCEKIVQQTGETT